MKVEKEKFDALLSKLIKAKPEPRKKIQTAKKKPAKIIEAPKGVTASEVSGRS